MKYVIRFQKTGVICYTSHLDIMKVFKRAFKRAGIRLSYSQGFNPHPKMGFAQPLSLGYESLDEYIEFETVDDAPDAQMILEKMRALMPEGLELLSIQPATHKKTLAADTYAADYMVEIPLSCDASENLMAQNRGDQISQEGEALPAMEGLRDSYLGQEQILTLKKMKKKKEPALVDIRPKIRDISFRMEELTDAEAAADRVLLLDMTLDSGSESNLSPELVISTVLEKFELDVPRSDINVTRTKIYFN